MSPSLGRYESAHLPADPGAEVLHSHPVVGPGGRSVLVQPGSPGVSPGPGAVPAPVSPGTTSVLHGHPLAHQLLHRDESKETPYAPCVKSGFITLPFSS